MASILAGENDQKISNLSFGQHNKKTSPAIPQEQDIAGCAGHSIFHPTMLSQGTPLTKRDKLL
jgi:hypothetical protein